MQLYTKILIGLVGGAIVGAAANIGDIAILQDILGRVEILGTDVPGEKIAKARAGIYSHFEVQRGLPLDMLDKYFH